MKKIALLGSTGSIGRQVLGVVDRYPEEYSVVALAANSSAKLLGEQIKKYKPLVAGLSDPAYAAEITDLPKQTSLYLGENALIHCVIPEADIVFVSVVGFCGLKAVLAALNMKKSLAFDKTRPFKKIILTASGGALRDLPIESLYSVTPEIALKHPNWNMGAKITIDCATMFNKGLEVMEAMWLYNAPLEKIDVLIHPQSIIHSMVEYADNALIAQLAVPSMDIPIQLALSYPDRKPSGVSALDLTKEPLTFMRPDHKRYPCFDIAINAAKAGGVYPCAASAANEVAVKLFLNGKIKFGEIADYISYATDNAVRQTVTEESLAFTDYNARTLVEKRFKENN